VQLAFVQDAALLGEERARTQIEALEEDMDVRVRRTAHELREEMTEALDAKQEALEATRAESPSIRILT